jgi:cysteine-rich repeat protein
VTANAWYGVTLLPGATQTSITWTTVESGIYGIWDQATTSPTINHATLQTNTYGILVAAGAPALDAMNLFNNTYGLYLLHAASATLTNSVVRSGSYGIYVGTDQGSGNIDVINSTIYGGSYGVYMLVAGGNSATANVKNSIVTQCSSYGIYRYTGSGTTSATVTYSDVWGNATNYGAVAAGTGTISQNPLFVSAPTDLHLQGSSVAIDAATATGAPNHDHDDVSRPINGDGINGAEFDMGAYEFVLTSACGDGVVNAGEACDDGALNGTYGHCKADCSGPGPHCGDSVVNGSEQCDDGNTSNTDGCLNTCLDATCGDGYVRAGVEACDDGNTSNTDGCLNSCVVATCGDGYTRAGVEDCDDGNSSNTDACLNSCKNASCGDGYVRAGV